MKRVLLLIFALLAGCAATPTVPTINGKNATISCSRLTSVYGVGTLIVVDLAQPRPAGAASITTDGNDCKTTITYTEAAKAAASGVAQ